MIKKLFGTGLCTLIFSVCWITVYPQVTCKKNVKIYLDATGMAMLTPEMFTDDDCAMCTVVEANSGSDVIDCDVAGKTIVARITQPNFFTTLCLAQVIDDMPPDFTGSDPTIEVPCDLALLEAPPDAFDIVVSDACGIDTIYPLICGVEPGDCDMTSKVLKVQWQAIDSSGNISSFMQMVSILKADLGDVTFPDDDTLYCEMPDLDLAGAPMVDDTIEITKFCGLFAGSMDDTMFICQSSWMVFRTWVVIDLCDLSSVDSVQIITVLDTMSPQIFCPPDDTIYFGPDMCTGQFIIPDTIPGMMTNCPPDDTTILAAFKINGGYYDLGDTVMLDTGSYEITILVADDCWNTNTCTYSLEVIDTINLDTIAPLLAFCPLNDTLILDSIDVMDTATNCTELNAQFGTVEFEAACCFIDQIFCELINTIDTAVADTGRYVRMWWAVDECGNISDTCIQTILVVDTLPPMLDFPQAFSKHEIQEPDHPPGAHMSPYLRSAVANHLNASFRLSPNPFSDHLRMQADIPETDVYIFEVLSVDGRKAWQEKRPLEKGIHTLEWNAGALGWPPGPLILRWISSGQTEAKRVLYYPE